MSHKNWRGQPFGCRIRRGPEIILIPHLYLASSILLPSIIITVFSLLTSHIHSSMAQNKPKSKRGRKPKAEWQRLRNEIKLHLDDGNYAVVKDMAREAGMSLNRFITRAVLGATIRKALTDDEYAMVRSLQGIANNLNQLARCANGMGFDSVATKVDSLLTTTLNLLSKFRM